MNNEVGTINFQKIAWTKESTFIFLFFLFFWSVFLIVTGTITSGYHLTDDHQLIIINEELSEESTLDVMKNWITKDFSGRFRPLYWIHRVIITEIIGLNFTLWSLYYCLLAVLTSVILSFFIIKFHLTIVQSILFSLFLLLGEHTTIWWRLGPQEPIGMFFLSAALYSAVKSNESLRNENLYNCISIMCIIAASLVKESFLVLLPFYVYLFLWFEKKAKGITFIKAIKNKTKSISILGIALTVELYVIFTMVGLNRHVHIGVDLEKLPYTFLINIFYTNVSLNYFYILLLAAIFYIVARKYDTTKEFSSLSKEQENVVLPLTFMFLLIIIPQHILYDKSGFNERYFLPMLFGYCFLVFVFLGKLNVIKRNIYLNKILTTIIIVIVIHNFVNIAYPNALFFAKEGRAIRELTEKIAKTAESGKYVLIAGNPVANYEWTESILQYLNKRQKINNFFIEPINSDIDMSKKYTDDEFDRLKSGYINRYKKNLLNENNDRSNICCVAILPGKNNEKTFLQNNLKWFTIEKYNRDIIGSFILYLAVK